VDVTTVDVGELPEAPPERITVVFDGHCGMCTRSARWLVRLDRHDRVEIVAAQSPGARERAGLSEIETDAAVWAVDRDGLRVGGARAVGLALAVARGSRWPILPWRVPGVPWLLDRCYRFVAGHRGWFPGETPWCEAHSGECE
jgi:predicted DCC family thiol-disulfide oxidoreductase YuxK